VSYGSPEVPIAALIAWSTLILNTLLCDPMLLMLVVLRLLGELREASEHDALTGLLNRRGMRAALDKLARAQGNAAQHPTAVLLIDVDHFKAVNDRHGHEIGDKVLVTVGNVLGTAGADHMHAVRWGGEEFCVVAANMERAAAVDLAERIRTRFNEASRQIPELSDGVTISVGVAAATVDTISGVMNLVSAADTALYAAKNAGRNRVEVAVGCAPQRVAA
jgi:diguanylate cyclase (GGDEF)-like protein